MNIWNINAGELFFANTYKLDTCYNTDLVAHYAQVLLMHMLGTVIMLAPRLILLQEKF